MATITVTGLDEKTDLAALKKLRGPRVEFGILYTAMPKGRHRYPRRGWIAEAVRELDGQCAIHVCGRAARNALKRSELSDILLHVKRVQINGLMNVQEVMECARQVDTVITQHCPNNEALVRDVIGIKHSVLVDASGGRGISPGQWNRPQTPKAVGFAGGLGPHNLRHELKRISAVAKYDWWIDMEERIRVDDWFSVQLAAEAIAIFSEVVSA